MKLRKNLPGIIALAVLLLIALLVYKDYGVTWDEPQQRRIALVSYRYIFEGDKELLTFRDRDYGVAFELPLVMIEKAMHLEDSSDIYLMRHLVTHLLFLLAMWFFYLLARFLTRNKWLALLAVAMVVLHPRIYAHSFLNSKDLPFLSVYVIGFYFAAKAFYSKKVGWFVLLGLCCGVLVNLRIMGVLLVVSVIGFMLLDTILSQRNSRSILRSFGLLAAFFISCAAMAIASWPYLWEDPAWNFMLAFQNMARFRWESSVLFFGKMVGANVLPWTYFPSWFGFTTPVLFLIFGVAGILWLIIDFFRKPLLFLQNTIARNYLLYLANFAGPIIAVIALHSVLYDGWRQLFFVYPPFVLLALYACQRIYFYKEKAEKVKWVGAGILGLYCAYILFFMVRNHPHQQVYFNEILPKKDEHLRHNFEMDYWGASYKQALEYIAKHEPQWQVKIKFENFPGEANLQILPIDKRQRFQVVTELAEADYFVSNYRWHPEEYNLENAKEVYRKKVINNTITTAWKLQNIK